MVYLHEMWLNGSREPQRLRMETEDLFQAYQRWLQSSDSATSRGFVFPYTEKDTTRTVALNFSNVSCMTVEKIDEESERRAMGFLRPR